MVLSSCLFAAPLLLFSLRGPRRRPSAPAPRHENVKTPRTAARLAGNCGPVSGGNFTADRGPLLKRWTTMPRDACEPCPGWWESATASGNYSLVALSPALSMVHFWVRRGELLVGTGAPDVEVIQERGVTAPTSLKQFQGGNFPANSVILTWALHSVYLDTVVMPSPVSLRICPVSQHPQALTAGLPEAWLQMELLCSHAPAQAPNLGRACTWSPGLG